MTFSADEDLAGKVSVAMSAEGATPAITVKEGVNTVTLTGTFTAGKDYYVAVLPGEKTNLTVRFNGYLSKNWTSKVNIQQGHVANAKVLTAPEMFTWGVVGQHQGWDISKPTPMYKVYEGTGDNNVNDVYAVLNIKLEDNGFKFAKFGLKNWDTANTHFGAWKKSSGKGYFNYSTEMPVGQWYDMWTNSCSGQKENLGVGNWSKSYDVYIKWTEYYPDSQHVYYTIVETGTKVSY